MTKTWKQLTIIIESWHSNIFLELWHFGTTTQTPSCARGLVSKHATFIKYRLNQIIKSNCVSDGSEMKIMIQWVTQSHSSMGFNLRPFENTFWNLMAALKYACIFWSIMVMVMARVFGRHVSVCGSICKIDLCLDIFGPYNCWENLFCQKNCPKTPRSQIPDIFSVPRFQIFWASIPRFQIFWASIPWFQMLIHPPPTIKVYTCFFLGFRFARTFFLKPLLKSIPGFFLGFRFTSILWLFNENSPHLTCMCI